ncbi:MAG: hypothetical protein A07HN63_00768 [uncultured archaeon A07HN63]|nr:MAG: hypothetical protein A07HN63_00768 [uncultured archaeon A07HN63]
MSEIPLTDEETRVIFAGEAAANLRSLEGSEQEQIISRLVSVLESESPPSAMVHERIGLLDIYTAGDQIRLYTRVVDEIPRGDDKYHLVYLFYIDDDHEYDRKELATYNQTAEAKLQEATSLETVQDVDAYLDTMNALDADDLRDLLD